MTGDPWLWIGFTVSQTPSSPPENLHTAMTTTDSKPVLCDTDFSGNSQRAAHAAAALAKRLGVPLRLVHGSVILGSPLTDEHPRTEAQRLHGAGADLIAEVIAGDANWVLTQAAQQHAARLVVASSLGRRGPARWLPTKHHRHGWRARC